MDYAATQQPHMSSGDFDHFKQENRDTTMHQDLGLDPSDPLNLLLNNNTSGSQDSSMEDTNSTSSHGSPADWSQLESTLWPQQQSKSYPDMGIGMDFLQQMDMDFNPSMAVDPSALQYNNTHSYNTGTFDLPSYHNDQVANELLSASFPFTFNSTGDDFSALQGKERRMSVTSSSASSSGASLSPVLEHTNAVPIPSNPIDPADELAQRVRQIAGVMLAVPAGSQYQPLQQGQTAKLPIPRLPNQPKLNANAKQPKQRAPSKSTTASGASSATSSPPPGSPAEDAVTHTNAVPVSATSVIPRPKTSHTTIERRYRTNLNARIQSLRQAVPALRVLEEKGKKGKKEGEEEGESKLIPGVDTVDERGFVDGVKVARKGSKANVLGKAVEYIRVLKKREARLKREQNGLKSLIGGLVGGPALLKEWEHEWRDKFGGEEKDEIEGEEAEPMSDDEDGDDDDGDEDDGRAKKKAKVVKAPKPPTAKKPTVPAPSVSGDPNVLPEKRKRGRPRKVLNPPPASPEDTTSLIPSGELVIQQPIMQSTQPQSQPAQQYLLATFALFSFFNSPLASSSSTSASHPPSHSGSVLGHTSAPTSHTSDLVQSYGWRELVQVFHLIVSALVFFSIVVPWLPKTIKRSRLASLVLSPFSSNFSESTPQSKPVATSTRVADRSTLLEALAYTRRGNADEADQLRGALGIPSGILGLLMGWRKSGGEGFERKGLEQRAWVRLGELAALDPTTSSATRLQTYWCMRSHISWFKASTSDLSTLALILRPLASGKAGALWSRAAKTEFVRPFERLVLTSLTVDEAAEQLASVQTSVEHTKHTPIGLLATLLVRERLLKDATLLFVRTVLPDHNQDSIEGNWVHADQDNKEEDMRKETIDAGKSLGGKTAELAEALEKVWATGGSDVIDIFSDDESEEDEVEVEIRSLLTALILYRRIFPSSILSCTTNGAEPVSFILSPPPSPSRKNADLQYALRMALGSPVFEFDGDCTDDEKPNEVERLGFALEDARDRVIDMLVEGEREGRARASKGC